MASVEDIIKMQEALKQRATQAKPEPTVVPEKRQELSGEEDFLVNFNYGLSNMLGLPVDAAASLLKLTGAAPNNFNPIGGSQSIREGLRALGLVLPEEGAEPEGISARAGRIAGGTVLPVMGMQAAGASLSTKAFNNLSSFQKGLVASYASPVKTVAAESAAVGAAALGGEIAQDAFPDSHVAGIMGELVGGFTPAIATSIVSKIGNVAPLTSNAKKILSKDGATYRAEKQIAKVTQSPKDALANLLDDSILELDPFTRANDVGTLSLMKAAVNKDPVLAKTIADSTENSISKARELVLGGGNPQATIDFLDGLRLKANARAQESLNKLATDVSPVSAARIIRSKVEESLAQARGVETAKWKKLSNEGSVDPTGIKGTYEALLRDRTIASDPEDIPKYLDYLVGKVDKKGVFKDGAAIKKPDFKVMKELRSRIGDDISAERAKDVPNRNKIRILRNLQDSIYNSLVNVSPDYEDAVNFSRVLNQKFTQGRVGRLLGYERSGGKSVTDEGTLDFLFSTKENIRKGLSQLKEASPETIPVVKEAIKADFNNTTILPNGAFDVDRARRFLKTKGVTLDEFPDIKKSIEDSIKTQTVSDEFAGASRGSNISKHIRNKSVTSLYLDTNPDNAMKRLIESKNSEGLGKVMKDMVDTVKQDKSGQAFDGLKTSYGQFLLKHAEENKKLDRLSGTSFLRLLRDTEPAAKQLYTKDELNRLNKIGQELLKLETREATQASGKVISDAPNKIISILGGTAAARTGAQLGVGTSGASLRTANIFSREYNQLLGRLTNDGAEQILMDSVTDPNLFKMLLLESTPQNLKKFNKVYGRLLSPMAVSGGLAAQYTTSDKPTTVQEMSIEEMQQELRNRLNQ